MIKILDKEKERVIKIRAIQILALIGEKTKTLPALKKQFLQEDSIEIKFQIALVSTLIEKKIGYGTKIFEEMKQNSELSSWQIDLYNTMCQDLSINKEIEILSNTVEKLSTDKPLSIEEKRNLQQSTKTIEDKLKTLYERRIDIELAKMEPPTIESLNALYSLSKTRVETVSTLEDINFKKAQTELALLEAQKRKAFIEAEKAERLVDLELKRAELNFKRTALQRFLINNGIVLLNIVFTTIVGVLTAILVFKK